MCKLRSRRSSRPTVIENLETRQLLSTAAGAVSLSHPGGAIHGLVGQALPATTLAVIHTADPAALAATVVGALNWGDGAVDGTVPGEFSIDAKHPDTILLSATHTYAKPGVYHLAVNIVNNAQSLGILHETVRIAPTSSNGRVIHGVAGQDFLTPLGSIAAAGIIDTGLTVDWGDGTSTPFLNTSGVQTLVSGNHTYSAAGTYRVTVYVGASPDQQVLVTDQAIITAAKTPLSVAHMHVLVLPPGRITAGVAFSKNLAVLTGIPQGVSSVTYHVNWGDNSTADPESTGFIIGDDVTANGQHTYSIPGTYSVTGVFSAIFDGQLHTQTFKERLRVSPGAAKPSLSAVTGTAFDGVLGTLTMSPGPTKIGIQWGDGFHSYGTFTAIGNHQYQINGSHTYSAAGDYTVSIIAADGYDPFPLPLQPGGIYVAPQTGFTGTLANTMHVTGPTIPIVPPGVTILPQPVADVLADQEFTATLATMSGYPTSADDVAQIYASVDWGIGFVSGDNPNIPVTVVNGQYVAAATHEYDTWAPTAQQYTVTITFLRNDTDANTGSDILGSTTTIINVLPTNTAGGVTLHLSPGVLFTGSVGTLPNPNGDVPNSIDWGDGSPVSGDITATPQNDGSYLITSSHTYAQAGTYRITVSEVNSLGTSNLVESLAVVGG